MTTNAICTIVDVDEVGGDGGTVMAAEATAAAKKSVSFASNIRKRKYEVIDLTGREPSEESIIIDLTQEDDGTTSQEDSEMPSLDPNDENVLNVNSKQKKMDELDKYNGISPELRLFYTRAGISPDVEIRNFETLDARLKNSRKDGNGTEEKNGDKEDWYDLICGDTNVQLEESVVESMKAGVSEENNNSNMDDNVNGHDVLNVRESSLDLSQIQQPQSYTTERQAPSAKRKRYRKRKRSKPPATNNSTKKKNNNKKNRKKQKVEKI